MKCIVQNENALTSEESENSKTDETKVGLMVQAEGVAMGPGFWCSINIRQVLQWHSQNQQKH